MKTKLRFLGVMALVVLAAAFAYQIEARGSLQRVHQHLTAPREAAEHSEAGEFCTHLPIVEIDTRGQGVPGKVLEENGADRIYETSETGETTITVDFSLRDGGQGANTLETRPSLTTQARIRYRGNSSRHFDKKSYAVHLVDEAGNEDPQELAGMSAHDEWVLNGPFLDRTLLRNYLSLNTTGEVMEYAPNLRYCELFVNGEYRGVYLLMETIARSAGRLNLSKPEKNRDTTSWIIRWDRAGKGDQELDNYTFYTYQADVSALDVRYPGRNLITEGRKEYIDAEVSKIERTLYSSDLSDPEIGCAKYLDLTAFAQYFVLNEFFRNVDAGRFSTFYYKDARGKVKPCVWDFNNACDNYSDYLWDEAGFTMQNAPWFSALLRDPVFVERVVSEYRRLRTGVLAEDSLTEYIDGTLDYLGSAVERNYEVWGYVFTETDTNHAGYLQPDERNYDSFEEAVEQLRDFLARRGNWLDEHIETLYQYCSDSKNANTRIY